MSKIVNYLNAHPGVATITGILGVIGITAAAAMALRAYNNRQR